MRRIVAVLLPVVVALQAHCGFGCGPLGRHLLSGGAEFNYQKSGSDWAERFPNCQGEQQSPININTTGVQTSFRHLTGRLENFGKGNGVRVKNTGQAVQVRWNTTEPPVLLLPVVDGHVSGSIDPLNPAPVGSFDINEEPSTRRFGFANVVLEQFHFHLSSENAIDGVLYPMEAHIVGKIPKEEVDSCGDEGCIVVFAIVYKISEEDNDFLQPFLGIAPEGAGEEFEQEFPEYFVVNFNKMIPEEKSYYTWKGSFTTPPCTEGVTWVLFDSKSTVSSRQLTLLESRMAAVRNTCLEHAEKGTNLTSIEECNNIGDLKNNRALQPLNGRVVYHVTSAPTAR